MEDGFAKGFPRFRELSPWARLAVWEVFTRYGTHGHYLKQLGHELDQLPGSTPNDRTMALVTNIGRAIYAPIELLGLRSDEYAHWDLDEYVVQQCTSLMALMLKPGKWRGSDRS